MTQIRNKEGIKAPFSKTPKGSNRRRGRRHGRWTLVLIWTGGLLALAALGGAWLSAKAASINQELSAATKLIPDLQNELTNSDSDGASVTVGRIRSHTAAAKDSANDPLWTLASAVPGFGANFAAVAEVARSADDVAALGLTPLVKVLTSLDWNTLIPNSEGTNLGPLKTAAPGVSSAAHAVRASADRLERIDSSNLLPQVAEPLISAREQLQSVTGALDAAADAASVAPSMLGSESPRNYLLMIQNNAEARSSGGIPGALAVLSLDNGKLALGAQSSASELGVPSPISPVDPVQQQIYSSRMGKFMQDVNLTPDFPTAASTARALWERKTGQRVDGVISIDPVTLGYILQATGPVSITNPELKSVENNGLPTELNGTNVVQTLLSDVYAKIEDPKLQDAYFASVAQEVFSALSDGKADAKALIAGVTRGSEEGRVLVWSGWPFDQSVLSKYSISGSVAGPSISPAQFGVYFNDGTGAKMDYYVKRTVELIRECTIEGYEQTTVRVTSTNAAPADAATSLPAYVTGGGVFGVPPGSIQTNIVAYGPVQANIETAAVDGHKVAFAAHLHSNRPVGVLALRLAPGETKTVDYTFGKIVQHVEPRVVVTPTVQSAKDVILPTRNSECG